MQTTAKYLLILCILYTVYMDDFIFAKEDVVNSPGVCEIEVPTVSILSQESKHIAASIKGNGSTPNLTKIKICCAGYTPTLRAPLNCVPHCPDGCGLGNCTAPNLCSCNKGAIMGPDGKCIATCPKSCLNGQCYNNNCNCNRGFILQANGQYCIPGCTKNCGEGGMCVGYDQCKCDKGYHLDKQGTCKVFCEKGYHQVGSICEPMCPEGCLNGICIAPNVCYCNSGWVLSNNGSACKPNCSISCLNGECTAPNVCSCKPGYIKDPNDSKGSRCIPYCPQGCPNGICSAPNFCICNVGYIKQAKGSNVCVKK